MTSYLNKNLAYLLFSCLLVACSFTTATANSHKHYTIVIDAGSSGSRLHIFEYVDRTDLTQLSTIKDIAPADSAITPGISAFAKHPQDAGPALKPLLNKAAAALQAAGADQQQAEFNLLATAGMRLLPDADQTAIYQALKDYLVANTPYKLKKIATISGKMEGVYDWLAVNYWQHNLQANKTSTASVLDMGGASTQIVFEGSAADDTDSYHFTLFNKAYVLSSSSFLGLGQDQARMSIANLACYPTGYPVSGLGVGAFNSHACTIAIDNMLAKQDFSKVVGAIPEAMQYVAFSGFYYTMNFFKVRNLVDLSQATHYTCVKNWDTLQKEHPTDSPKYLANYCFNSLYITELLQFGYRFSKTAQEHIQFTSQVNDQAIDWAVGVVVEEMIQDLNQAKAA